MIRIEGGREEGREQKEQKGSGRVNWLTQRGSRQEDMQGQSQERRLIDTSNIRHLKLCLRKEISLIPAQPTPTPTSLPPQGNETIPLQAAHLNVHSQRIGVSQDPNGQYSSGNSHKNSCEKRGKLSLISKRPSLRKISDFISFKQDGENVLPGCHIERKDAEQGEKENGKDVQGEIKPVPPKKQAQGVRKQIKKCIRISSKRQCLAELIKN